MLHTHDFDTIALGWDLVRGMRAKGSRVHWVHDFHEYLRGIAWLEAETLELALRDEASSIWRVDERLAVSPPIAEALRHDYGLRVAPTVLLNTNAPRQPPARGGKSLRKEIGLAPSVPLAVYTGRVVELRGVRTLVDALASLPELHVALVTEDEGPYFQGLMAAAARAGTADRLHVTGYVPPMEVASFVRDAAVGVHPMLHYPNAELASPNKVFDYLMAGIPLVFSDCRTMADLVRRLGVGEVFAAGDADDLAGKLRVCIAGRRSYLAAYSRNAELIALLSWEAQREVLRSVYARAREALASREASSGCEG